MPATLDGLKAEYDEKRQRLYESRRLRVRTLLEAADWSMAEAARRIGYSDDNTAGQGYVRNVLGGHATSSPILGRVEGALSRWARDHAEALNARAASGDRAAQDLLDAAESALQGQAA